MESARVIDKDDYTFFVFWGYSGFAYNPEPILYFEELEKNLRENGIEFVIGIYEAHDIKKFFGEKYIGKGIKKYYPKQIK